MHAAVTRGVDVVLAGSIRDDGPLPDTITDTQVAQSQMREVAVRYLLLAQQLEDDSA